MTVRAKFTCMSEVSTRWSPDAAPSRSYKFMAVYDTSTPEDRRFAKATPIGSLEIAVDNPAVAFVPGVAYYLDITPVDPA